MEGGSLSYYALKPARAVDLALFVAVNTPNDTPCLRMRGPARAKISNNTESRRQSRSNCAGSALPNLSALNHSAVRERTIPPGAWDARYLRGMEAAARGERDGVTGRAPAHSGNGY
jgi:hypothetical protein